MEPSAPALEVKDVGVTYTDRPVIDSINLSISGGETFGLIGLNGVGKTTLIKCILGLRQPNQGHVRIFGLDSGRCDSRRNLAYLPERFDPPWFLSGMEFVKFSVRMYGQPFDAKEVLAYAERLALDPSALKRRVQTYSKGMRQKLGLIATVLTRCKLLILDEPMSGLDPMARALVKDMLMKARIPGQTIFLSSHILADMDEICSRVAILHDSHIQFAGSPAELKSVTSCQNLERAFLQFIEKDRAA